MLKTKLLLVSRRPIRAIIRPFLSVKVHHTQYTTLDEGINILTSLENGKFLIMILVMEIFTYPGIWPDMNTL